MEILFYLFLLFLLFSFWIRFKDYFHPAFVTAAVWLFIIAAYNYVIRKTNLWIPLSDKFYLAIILYISFFVIFSETAFLNSSKKEITFIKFGLKHKLFLYISIFCLLISNVYYINLIKSVGFVLLREKTEFGTTLPFYVKVSSYLMPVGNVLFLLGISDKTNKQKYKFQLFILASMILISAFISMNKGGLIQLAVCVFYLLKVNRKLNKRTFIILILVFLGFIISLQILRSGNESASENFFARLFYIYFLSPVPAMDAVVSGIKNLNTGYFGTMTLGFMYRVLNKIGAMNIIPSTLLNSEMWIEVPYMTNVYTMPGGFYIDFGIFGMIICGIIYGSIFGKIYSGTRYKNSLKSKLFYGLYLYCIVFQFFGDWFLGFFSVTIQYLFWIFIFTHRFKTYALKIRSRI